MAYRALYRKYRPDTFNGVVGQKAIIKTLQNIVREGKISHAYLFSGPRGTGKTSVAKIFAKAINCLNPKEGMPCDECAICKQFKEDQINDIIEIDAASNNGVDEIRDLKSKINLATSICKYKVYIIDEVHMLSIGAFNALLKTLEEPPQHVIFILATTEMHKLPLTIISRCQNYNFKKITEDQMKLRLSHIVRSENINIDDEALDEIVCTSDGGMRDAISLLEQLCSFTNNKITACDVELLSSSVSRKDIASIINNMIDGNTEQIFKLNDSFYQSGKDFLKIAEDIVIFLKDILLYKKAPKYFAKNCNYKFNEYMELFNKITDNIIYKYIGEINNSIVDIKISNHPKIIFEITLLKMIDTPLTTSKNTADDSNENIVESEGPLKKIDNITVLVEHEEKVEKQGSNVYNETVTVNKIATPRECEEVKSNDFLPLINMPLYKKNLINNTLAEADKKLLSKMNDKFGDLSTFLINKKFKQAVSILMDSKIVGVSSDNMVLTYQYEAMVDKADNMLNEIEDFIDSIANKKLKVINITDSAWHDIRPYFVKMVKEKGKIEIIPEVGEVLPKVTSKQRKGTKEVEEAISMFGEDLIEVK